MLPIYICEDHIAELYMLDELVHDYVNFHFEQVKPQVHSFTKLNDLLDTLIQNKCTGIYLLDLNLDDDMDGISLAVKIREHDPMGFIIFVTSYSECAPLTFEFQVGALAYISKEKPGIRENVTAALNCAYTRYNSFLSIDNSSLRPVLKIKSNERYYDFMYHDVKYIITSNSKQHMIDIHTTSSTISIYASMKNIESQIESSDFFKCSRSAIVNVKHVSNFDAGNRLVHMNDGYSIEIPKRRTSAFAKFMKYPFN